MDRFQKNTIKSFRKAKEDIRNLQAQITELMRNHEDLMEKFDEIRKISVPRKVVTRVVKRKA